MKDQTIYIKVDASKRPKIRGTYITDLGTVWYKPNKMQWICERYDRENDEYYNDICKPEWYLKEINLTELMVDITNWLPLNYQQVGPDRWEKFTGVEEYTTSQILTEYLTKKGYGE